MNRRELLSGGAGVATLLSAKPAFAANALGAAAGGRGPGADVRTVVMMIDARAGWESGIVGPVRVD